MFCQIFKDAELVTEFQTTIQAQGQSSLDNCEIEASLKQEVCNLNHGDQRNEMLISLLLNYRYDFTALNCSARFCTLRRDYLINSQFVMH